MPTPHGFWVNVADNRVFDGVVTRHLVTHGDIVVINAFYDSSAYPYHDLVQRLHEARQGFRVLFYTWAGRKPLGGTKIGAVPTLDGMECPEFSHLLLKNAQDQRIEVIKDGQTWIFLDPLNCSCSFSRSSPASC